MRKLILLALACLALLALVLVSVPLSNAEHSMIYRARITCLNKTTGLIETLRLTNGQGHYDAEGNEYFPGLTTSLDIERRIFKDGTTYGGSSFALGNIVATNVDGRMDQYRAYAFDGRDVVVEAATSEAGPWLPVWTGAAAYPELDLDTMTLKLSDRQEELTRKLVQEAVYEGEDDEIEGQKPPLIYGRVLNAPLTLIDTNLQLYQASARDGGVVTVEQVYDSGVSLGQEIFLNPNFDEDLYWAMSYGIISGEILINSPSSPAQASYTNKMNLVEGAEYVFAVNVTNIEKFSDPVPGTVVARISSSIGHQNLVSVNEDGYIQTSFTLTLGKGDGYYFSFVVSSANFSATSISMQPVVTDHATRAELEAATVPHGGYHTCLAEGLIRLGSPPEGQVTADVVGTSPGTVPEICRQLLLDQASFSVADFDDAAFAALSNANPSAAGVYLAGDESFQEALDLLMGSVGAWWGFDRAQGKLTCGRVEIPVSAARTLQVEYESLGELKRVPPRDDNFGIPAWRVTVRHTRNWTVQGSGLVTAATVFSGLGGVVSEDRRVWLSKEYREAVAEDADIKDDHLMSGELDFDTLLLEGAATEAARRLAFYSGDRERYKLTVPMELLFDASEGLTLDLGQGLELICDRFGLAAGKTFLIIGMTEVYNHEGDKVELDLLG